MCLLINAHFIQCIAPCDLCSNQPRLTIIAWIYFIFFFFAQIAISHWSLNYKRTLLCVCQHSDNTLKITILLGFVGHKTLKKILTWTSPLPKWLNVLKCLSLTSVNLQLAFESRTTHEFWKPNMVAGSLWQNHVARVRFFFDCFIHFPNL